MDKLGERARARREQLGLRQEEVAEFCKVTQQAYQQLEAGDVRRPRYLDDLAVALKTSKAWLKSGKGDPDVMDDPLTPEERQDAEYLRAHDPEGWDIVRQILRREAKNARERHQQ